MVLKVIPIGMNDQTLSRRIAEIVSHDSLRMVMVPHAKKRMRQRNVNPMQVLRVLTTGRVVERAHRNIHGNWQCTLEAIIAGDRIKVVAALQGDQGGELVVVVTVMN